MKYEACIGLETHVMQKTRTKMFCGCRHEYGAAPNTNVCPVCLGYPGAMPVMNAQAIELICKAGLLLGCEINPRAKWDRKNYFYPDMAKNYQITQADQPICLGGAVTCRVDDETKTFTIERIHQEENAAKNTHVAGASLIDYNRAGTALMEIVSDPCMHSADDALAYMTAVKQIMQYGGISDCDLEKGHMRSDVNISVRPEGSEKLGAKVEIKNMNSFSFIVDAIHYEIKRQVRVLESGGTVEQETRGYDTDRGETFTQRTKEDAHDYRYFPEPDLMPVKISAEQLAQWRGELPELPDRRRARYVQELGLPEYDAGVLTAEREVADFYEEAVRLGADPKKLSNWVMTELMRVRSETGASLSELKITPASLAALIQLVEKNTISSSGAKDVFELLIREGGDPAALVKKHGLAQVSDTGELDGMVEQVISENEPSVTAYRGGKTSAIQYLVGQVMKMSRGKANPKMVQELLRNKLD